MGSSYPSAYPLKCLHARILQRRTDLNQIWMDGSLRPEEATVPVSFQYAPPSLAAIDPITIVLMGSIPSFAFLFFATTYFSSPDTRKKHDGHYHPCA